MTTLLYHLLRLKSAGLGIDEMSVIEINGVSLINEAHPMYELGGPTKKSHKLREYMFSRGYPTLTIQSISV